MKILIYSHFFYPEVGAGSIRMQFFAKVLRESGHQVKIVTPLPNYPQGKIYSGFKKFYAKNISRDICYLPIFLSPKHSLLKRGLSYISYFFSSLIFSLFSSYKPDVIITSSPPISTSLAATFVAKLKRAKLVLDVRDIWPDIGIELGIIKSKLLIKILKTIERYILNNASYITVTAEGDQKNLEKKNIPSSKIITIYNGADTELFKPSNKGEKIRLRKKFNLPTDKMILIYFGFFNYGMNDFELLGEALSLLSRFRNKIHFIALGDGDKRNEFLNRISGKIDYSYMNILQGSDVAEILSICDLSIIPLKKINRNTGGFIPVKCFESWASGIPVLLSAINDSEIAKIFLKCSAGKLIEPGNLNVLINGITSIIESPQLEELGKMGREYVKLNFDRYREAEKMNSIVNKLSVVEKI